MNAPVPGPLPPSVISPTPTFPPDKKVWAGGLAGLTTWLIFFVAAKVGMPIDPSLQGLISLAIGYGVSYLVPPALHDVVDRVNNDIVKLANADPSNPTQAVVVDLATSKLATAKDIASGAVPVPVKGTIL